MTLDEIKKAVQSTPSLAKEIAIWSTNETDEGKEILKNFAKAETEKAIREKTAEIYTNIDNDLFEVLGVRKKNDQKTYDFLKEIAKEHKELKAKADKLNESEEIKKLKAQIKEMQEKGGVNEHFKKLYEEATANFNKEKKELQEQIKAKEQEFFEAQVEADLRAGLSGLKFKEGIDQDVIDTIVNAKKQEIIKGAKIIEGKVMYYKEDGVTPLLNKEHKPITPKEIWSEKLRALIDSGTQTSGGGASTTVKGGTVVKTGEGDNATIKVVLDKESFSTKVEFNDKVDEALRKQGIAVGSKEYNEAMLGAYKEYEVDKLPLQ